MEKEKKDHFTDLMLDVESLGNEGKFVVTEISFVPFCLDDKFVESDALKSSFNTKISVNDSLRNGFKINGSTVEWWVSTDKELFKKQFDGTLSLLEVCDNISEYIDSFKNAKRVWATAVLDYFAISNIFNECGKQNPITYNKRMCARTVNSISEMLLLEKSAIKNNNDHNSINDCVNQIIQLSDNFNKLKNIK